MYSAASLVADYTPHLLENGALNFTNTSRPTKAAVERFLSAGCAIIHTRLQSAGYNVPVDPSTSVYEQVVELETLYGVSRAEMVRMTARVAANERTRSQMFSTMFNQGLDALMKTDLSEADVGHGGTQLYSRGISSSDKSAVDGDGDRVAPRFRRDQFRHSGTNRPGAVGSDALTD